MRRIIFLNLVFISVIAFSMTACDADQPANQYYWDQTKCGDPWDTGENNSNDETVLAITDYLESYGIEVISITFNNKSDLDIYCESCGCGTGQRIFIIVAEGDTSKMETLLFRKA